MLQLFILISYIPEHRCQVPICDNEVATPVVNADFIKFALPGKHNVREFLNDGYDHDPCSSYSVLGKNAPYCGKNMEHYFLFKFGRGSGPLMDLAQHDRR